MKTIHTVQNLEQLKCLADARRLTILRLLMAGPNTLTGLGLTLHKSPAWVQHHMRALLSAGLVELSETRVRGRATEKLYQSKAGGLLLEGLVLPSSKTPVVIFSGSHDLALDAIADHLGQQLSVLGMPVGSLNGLVNLRQGLCQFSGAHLLDASGEYNTPFIRHLFPDREVLVITLANRTQGMMVAAGNPKGISTVASLARPGIRLINRNRGSGTRLWFDTELQRLGLPVQLIGGYQQTVKTHTAAAELVQGGKADVAVGLEAAAFQHGLGFIPLFEERYDLILPRENERTLVPLLEFLQTSTCRSEMNSLPGYNTVHSGEEIRL